jgi:hypothetical protein
LDTPTPKQQFPADQRPPASWLQTSSATLPWLSIAAILMALIAIGYVVQLLS